MNTLATLSSVTRPAWVDSALYPFASKWASVPAGQMHYVDEGPSTAPTVLFSHGTPSWSFEWRHVIAKLARDRRCVAPDHLGFGLSEKPAHFGYKPRDHAAQLAAFMEALDLRDVTLVIHDFGGPIGIGAALAQLPRVRSIVVTNSWMWPLDDEPSVAKISSFVRGPVGRFLYRRLNFSPRVLLPSVVENKSLLTRAVKRHYLAPFPSYEARVAPWVLGCELAGSSAYYAELWSRRDELAPKVREVVWAARDKTFGDRYLARWREAFPLANATVAPASGHFVAEEAPAEVAEAIRRASAPATA